MPGFLDLSAAITDTRNVTTDICPFKVPSYSVPVFVILAAVTIVGNVLVIFTIRLDPYRELRTISNFLVMNLAVSDLVVGVVSEPLMILMHWHCNDMIRPAFTTMYAALCSSCLTILALTVERYIVLEFPLTSWLFLKPPYIKLCTLTIWIISIVLSLFPVMFMFWHSKIKYEMFLSYAVGFPILVIMFVLYLRIYILIQRCHERTTGEDLSSSTQGSESSENQPLLVQRQTEQRIRHREMKVAKAIFLFVGVFSLCWVPSFIVQNLLFFCGGQGCITQDYANFFNFLGLLNSALNPLLYAMQSKKFRRAVGQLCSRDNRR